MVNPVRPIAPAAAMFAAALFLMSAGCSGGDDNDATDAPTENADASATPASSGGAITNVDLATDAAIRIIGIDPGDLLTGTTSLASGDFNDDGEPDLLIGAPQGDGPANDRPDAGEAYVIFGPIDQARDLAVSQGDVVIYGASSGDGLGYSVLAADVNDDDNQDVIVGAPGVTAGFDPRTDQGRVYVFYGGPDFEDTSTLDLTEDVFDLTITGAEGFSRLGHSMAAGDVNGDETGDLIVGAPFAGRPPGSPPGSERTYLGEAYVILGNEDLRGEKNMARAEYDTLISGAFANGEFGSSVAVADINDDGMDDIIAGAHRASAGEPARGASGAAYIFYGEQNLPDRLSVVDGDESVAILGSAGATLGYPVASGDFDGDGVQDFAMGAQLEATEDVQGSGAIYVFFGGGPLKSTIDLAEDKADVRVAGRETSEFLPSSLSAADLDGDGRSEILAGSMLIAASDDRFGAGLVYVISLPNDPPESLTVSDEGVATVLGEKEGDRLGNALGAAVLGEDVPAVAALAPLADDAGTTDRGIVYLVGFQ